MKPIQHYRNTAAALHSSQMYGLYPYTYHLAMVEMVVREHYSLLPTTNMDEMLVAAWFHDVLEDVPNVTAQDLLEMDVPANVVEWVKCVTDGPGNNRRERKQAVYAACSGNLPATFLKLADRIANVRCSRAEGNRIIEMYKREHEDFVDSLWIDSLSDMFYPLTELLFFWEQ